MGKAFDLSELWFPQVQTVRGCSSPLPSHGALAGKTESEGRGKGLTSCELLLSAQRHAGCFMLFTLLHIQPTEVGEIIPFLEQTYCQVRILPPDSLWGSQLP